MRIATTILAATAALCGACTFPTEGAGEGESESSSSESDGSTSVAPTTTLSSSSTSEPGTSDEEDGSGSGSDGASDSSSGSTGEPLVDSALSFVDVTSIGTSTPIPWTAVTYTVEAWIEIADEDAHGTILDHQGLEDGVAEGWLLAIDPITSRLIFRVWYPVNQDVTATGPEVTDLGVGWHHVAATRLDLTLLLFVDGVQVDATLVDVSAPPRSNDPILLGYTPNAAEWILAGIVVDDVRITDAPRYTEAFEPQNAFDADTDSMLLWRFDEGEGLASLDDVSGTAFAFEQPTWVPGHE